ncbi:hypothetical protein D3C87_2059470 [compost metagenome]
MPMTEKVSAGPVPGLKASIMVSGSPSAAYMPVLRLIGMRLMPSGRRNLPGGVPATASCMNSLKIGADIEPPVAPRPSGAGLSKPI